MLLFIFMINLLDSDITRFANFCNKKHFCSPPQLILYVWTIGLHCNTIASKRARALHTRHYGASLPCGTTVNYPRSVDTERLPDLNSMGYKAGAWCRAQTAHWFSTLLIWSGALLLHGPVCSTAAACHRQGDRPWLDGWGLDGYALV